MDSFDDLVRWTDPAMIVVTAAADEPAGCLVGFHTQCSIDPPRYAVWLSKANHTFRVAMRASHLGVHFLTDTDLAVARHFGTTTGDDIEKFSTCAWSMGPHGAPLLDQCPHRFEGRILTMLDDGCDHATFVIEPEAVASPGRYAPLRLSGVEHLDSGHDADDPSVA